MSRGAHALGAFYCISALSCDVIRRFIILKLTIVLRSSSLRVAVVVVVIQYNSRSFTVFTRSHHNQPPPSTHSAPQGNGRTRAKMARRCTGHFFAPIYDVGGPPRRARACLWRRRPRRRRFLETGCTESPLILTLFCKRCISLS